LVPAARSAAAPERNNMLNKSDALTAPASKKMLWAGRSVSALVVLFLLFDSLVKLMQLSLAVEPTIRLGYPESLVLGIGMVELVCLVVYAIPPTSILGAILLTGYLGGATATHVRIGDPFFFPIVVGVLVWLGLFLRDNRLRALLPLRS
jgi:DoxX-like family